MSDKPDFQREIVDLRLESSKIGMELGQMLLSMTTKDGMPAKDFYLMVSMALACIACGLSKISQGTTASEIIDMMAVNAKNFLPTIDAIMIDPETGDDVPNKMN